MLISKTYRRILDEQSHVLVAQGNHAAYLQFIKRYKRNALSLAYDLIDSKYKGLGIPPLEIASVCNDHFPYVVKKFTCGYGSFYTFWRRSVELQINGYVNDNYFSDKSKLQSSMIHIDENNNEFPFDLDRIAETDENEDRERLICELRRIMIMHKSEFEHQEFMLLWLTLDGYKLTDFEHTGINSLSTIYLTFNKATTRLLNIIKRYKKK